MITAEFVNELRSYITKYLEIKKNEHDSFEKFKTATLEIGPIINALEGKSDKEALDALIKIADIADKNQLNGYENSDFTAFLYLIIHSIRNQVDPQTLKTRIQEVRKDLNDEINAYVDAKKPTINLDKIILLTYVMNIYIRIRHLTCLDPNSLCEQELKEIKRIYPDKITTDQIKNLASSTYNKLPKLIPDNVSNLASDFLNRNIPKTVSNFFSSVTEIASNAATSAASAIVTKTMSKVGYTPCYKYPENKSTDVYEFNEFLPMVVQDQFRQFMWDKYWGGKRPGHQQVQKINPINKIEEKAAEHKEDFSVIEEKNRPDEIISTKMLHQIHFYSDFFTFTEETSQGQHFRKLIDEEIIKKTQSVKSWLELAISIGFAADEEQKKTPTGSLYNIVHHIIRHLLIREIKKNAPQVFDNWLEFEKANLVRLQAKAAQLKKDKMSAVIISTAESDIHHSILRLAYLGFTDPLLALRHKQFKELDFSKFEFSSEVTAYGFDTSKYLPLVFDPQFPEMMLVKLDAPLTKYRKLIQTESDISQELKEVTDVIKTMMNSSHYKKMAPKNSVQTPSSEKLTSAEIQSFVTNINEVKTRIQSIQSSLDQLTSTKKNDLMTSLDEQMAHLSLCETIVRNYAANEAFKEDVMIAATPSIPAIPSGFVEPPDQNESIAASSSTKKNPDSPAVKTPKSDVFLAPPPSSPAMVFTALSITPPVETVEIKKNSSRSPGKFVSPEQNVENDQSAYLSPTSSSKASLEDEGEEKAENHANTPPQSPLHTRGNMFPGQSPKLSSVTASTPRANDKVMTKTTVIPDGTELRIALFKQALDIRGVRKTHYQRELDKYQRQWEKNPGVTIQKLLDFVARTQQNVDHYQTLKHTT